MGSSFHPDKALIFRITHVSNVPWILAKGLHCANGLQDPDFVPIGDSSIIENRRRKQVPVPPYGTLSDYVPFYFTPHSPMLYNIKTGHRGVMQRANSEVVILVSSLYKVCEHGGEFVFTDRHAAASAMARFSSELDDLAEFVPWELLRMRDFQRDPEWPDKLERYQAEALIRDSLPPAALLGIVCSSEGVADDLRRQVAAEGLAVQVHVRAGWYF